VLYEDGALQVGIKMEFQREMGRLMIYYGNSSMTPLNSFQSSISSVAGLQVQAQPVVGVIAPKAQAQQLVNVVATGEILDPPTLQISFVTTKPANITLRLPIVATKFTEPLRIQSADFFTQWKNWSTKPLEQQEVFKAGKPIEIAWVNKVINDGLHIGVLKGVDPSINNIVAAGNFFQSGASLPVLARLETNPQANMYRLTVRSPSERLTSAVLKLLVSHLSASS
jgi:AP-2 complex subunit alpha